MYAVVVSFVAAGLLSYNRKESLSHTVYPHCGNLQVGYLTRIAKSELQARSDKLTGNKIQSCGGTVSKTAGTKSKYAHYYKAAVPLTLNPKPETLNPQKGKLNPKPLRKRNLIP